VIPLCVPEIRGNEWKYVKECLDTAWVSYAGGFVSLFEERFAAYIGADHAVAAMNGTAALHLALVALGIGPGDEVIVPTLTFVAPVNAVTYTGATPVFVDAEERTWNMEVRLVEEKITGKTRAILPVHLYGHPVDLDPLLEIAGKYGLYIVEDASESLGAGYRGKNVGAVGDAGCFSFNANKLITTGGGGMLVTNNAALAEKARFLSSQAKAPGAAYFHPDIGYNYRMTNVQAAMGLAQLEQIEDYLKAKRANALLYDTQLAEVKGIVRPLEEDWAVHSYWLYSVLVDGCPLSRDELMMKLADAGIESRPFFLPIHSLPPYRDRHCGDFPAAGRLSGQGLNLPSSVSLKEEEILRVCRKLKELTG